MERIAVEKRINQIGERLRELRIENKLSQAELGAILSTSQDTISLWEKGKSLPSAEFLIALSKFFSVSTDYILCLVDY